MSLYARAREHLFPGLGDVASRIISQPPEREDELGLNEEFESGRISPSVSTTTNEFGRSHATLEAAIEFEILQENRKLKMSLPEPSMSDDEFVKLIKSTATAKTPSLHELRRDLIKRCRLVCNQIVAKRRACSNRARVERELHEAAQNNAQSASVSEWETYQDQAPDSQRSLH